MLDPRVELADLHIHVGGAVAPHILWSIAHDQGFKLPVQTYWEFRDLVTAAPEKVSSLGDYLAILHQWTEKIQSSPAAIELRRKDAETLRAKVYFPLFSNHLGELVAALAEDGILTSSRDGNLRVSAHCYNTHGDIDVLLEGLKRHRALLAA